MLKNRRKWEDSEEVEEVDEEVSEEEEEDLVGSEVVEVEAVVDGQILEEATRIMDMM